jgi:long-subunit fatty acid transport protein
MRIACIAAALLGLASAAWAQDQQLGARTKAMGGSYTAFEDDPVSIWLNPAGIATQPDQLSISYQTYTAYKKGRERGPGDTTEFTVEPEATMAPPAYWPSYLGFVFQLGDAEAPLAMGVCFARPYLLQYSMDLVTDPAQTTFVPQSEVEQSLGRFRAAIAKDFLFRPRGEAGLFTHLSAGAGLDLGYAEWKFKSPTEDEEDTLVAPGFGAGLLLGVYDNFESFRVNLGLAYQSAAKYPFGIETDILPAFDMPQQFNAGMTFYLLQGTPLRLTADLQWIDWSATAEDPIFDTFPGFEDALNVSFGAEYRIKVAERVNLYPRAGYRRFDAPWADPDDLPMTGSYRLVLDTGGATFNIFTAGLGVGWTTADGKTRSIDVGIDAGGDAVNAAVGLNYEF